MKSALLIVLVVIACFSFVVADEEGEAQTYFSTGDYRCVFDSTSAYWQSTIDSTSIIWVYNSTYATGACNRTSTASWCCPTGFECREGRCQGSVSGRPITSCFDFSQTSCDLAPSEYATSLIESFDPASGLFAEACSGDMSEYNDGVVFCQNTTYCKCVWDDGLDMCTFGKVNESFCYDSSSGLENTTNRTCEWYEVPDSKQDSCSSGASGKITVFYTATGDSANDPLCTNQALEYPCSVSVKLPFFDKFSFIFAGLAIALVYFIIRRK